MRRFYTSTKDASIHSEFPYKNTGRDEILEIGKTLDGLNSIRTLMQFDIATISASFANNTIPSSASFDLKLYIARADDLDYQQTIEIATVSSSWVEGTGYFYQNTNVPYTSSRNPMGGYFENDGVTWKNRQSASMWVNSGSDFGTSSLAATVADPVVDIIMDVTTLIRTWVSGTVSNNGCIIKFPTTDESSNRNIGNVRVFSRNTHTIYTPLVIAKWNDQLYVTGTLSASAQPTLLTVLPRNLRPRYRQNQSIRVDLSVRDLYPVRTFNTAFSAWDGQQYLPATSYFSVVDQQSNTTIIPFDDYSLVSCDGTSSYAAFRTDALSAGRYYKILFKVVDQGYEQVFDNAHTFTIDAG
jgi:hypothetical protein